MPIIKNRIIPGSDSFPMAYDLFYNESELLQPLLIYAHGFNGFKDWGNFDLIAQQALEAGFAFLKFNFSHNGTIPEFPEEFVDLDAFAENNYSKEVFDLKAIIDFVCSDPLLLKNVDVTRIGLIGHSMGGGICILHTAADPRIKALATWASISHCSTPWTNWPSERIQEWKLAGVAYIPNSRTGQQMPLNYQLYEDYQQHKEQLDILGAIARIQVPILICHGRQDPSVPFSSAQALKAAQEKAELFALDTDHVFGRKHPYDAPVLPVPMQEVLNKSLDFFKTSLINK